MDVCNELKHQAARAIRIVAASSRISTSAASDSANLQLCAFPDSGVAAARL
jgi:hypothetical protein